MKKYDVIVVGAGNGGLACANLLAKNGKKVLVLEQSYRPGGFAGSFKRGRFEFDISLHELCAFGRYDKPFGAVRQLFDNLGISDKIDWVDVPEAFRLINFDANPRIDVTMPFGISEFCSKLEEYVPGSKKGINQLFALGEELRLTIEALGKVKSTPLKLAVLLKKGGFLHTAPYSVDEVLSKIKMPEEAKNIFKAYWAYLCVDCETLSFVHYTMMLNSYIELKSAIPRCRSQEIVNCLVNCLRENNGDLWLNSKVTKIEVSDDICKNVVLEDGTKIYAEDIVCDISPHIAYSKLIDFEHIPEQEIKKANARKFSGKGFCTFIGLNKSADELGLNEYSYFIFPDMDTKKQYKLMASPETNRVQNTVCLNAANPEASPEGTCILCMTTLFTSDWWENVKETEYFAKKEAYADIMIDTFEKATGIKIREHIEEIEIATPETFARFTGTPQGTIYGYHQQDWDGILQRTMSSNLEKHIDNLHFVGGWGERLLGYSSAFSSGRDCANKICYKNKEGSE